MNLSADCMFCLITRQMQDIESCEDEELKSHYMRQVLRAVAGAPPEATAPVVVAEINRLYQKTFGRAYSFEALKREYNALLLQRERELRARIEASADPLRAAVKLARAGNYIDFGAMSNIEEEKLDALLLARKAKFWTKRSMRLSGGTSWARRTWRISRTTAARSCWTSC